MRLRRVPGCPLVFVSRTVLVMEQPSGKSKAEFEKAEVGSICRCRCRVVFTFSRALKPGWSPVSAEALAVFVVTWCIFIWRALTLLYGSRGEVF